MRLNEQNHRKCAARTLAEAYTGYSGSPRDILVSSPSHTARSRGAVCKRPASATSFSPYTPLQQDADRTFPSRMRNAVCARDSDHLCEEFCQRRDDTRRRRKAAMCMTRTVIGTGGVVDFEDLENENQRLKLALTKATEENRKYRVHKARLEGELLRADGKIEALIAQIAIPPGRRDLRLMRAVRSEVEKCAVVRSLVKQRDHMQQLLSNREAELDTLKRTQEWSAVAEMTAATEEYFVEIEKLRRLVAQLSIQHSPVTTSRAGAVSRHADDENFLTQEGETLHSTPRVHDEYGRQHLQGRRRYTEGDAWSTRRPRSSRIDENDWQRVRVADDTTSFADGVDGISNEQNTSDVEAIARGEIYRTHCPRTSKACLREGQPSYCRWIQGGPGRYHEKSSSPIRKRSPPRTANMAVRTARTMTGAPKSAPNVRAPPWTRPCIGRPSSARSETAESRRARGSGGSGDRFAKAEASRDHFVGGAVSVGTKVRDVGAVRRGRPLSAPARRHEAGEQPETDSNQSTGRREQQRSWARPSPCALNSAAKGLEEGEDTVIAGGPDISCSRPSATTAASAQNKIQRHFSRAHAPAEDGSVVCGEARKQSGVVSLTPQGEPALEESGTRHPTVETMIRVFCTQTGGDVWEARGRTGELTLERRGSRNCERRKCGGTSDSRCMRDAVGRRRDDNDYFDEGRSAALQFYSNGVDKDTREDYTPARAKLGGNENGNGWVDGSDDNEVQEEDEQGPARGILDSGTHNSDDGVACGYCTEVHHQIGHQDGVLGDQIENIGAADSSAGMQDDAMSVPTPDPGADLTAHSDQHVSDATSVLSGRAGEKTSLSDGGSISLLCDERMKLASVHVEGRSQPANSLPQSEEGTDVVVLPLPQMTSSDGRRKQMETSPPNGSVGSQNDTTSGAKDTAHPSAESRVDPDYSERLTADGYSKEDVQRACRPLSSCAASDISEDSSTCRPQHCIAPTVDNADHGAESDTDLGAGDHTARTVGTYVSEIGSLHRENKDPLNGYLRDPNLDLRDESHETGLRKKLSERGSPPQGSTQSGHESSIDDKENDFSSLGEECPPGSVTGHATTRKAGHNYDDEHDGCCKTTRSSPSAQIRDYGTTKVETTTRDINTPQQPEDVEEQGATLAAGRSSARTGSGAGVGRGKGAGDNSASGVNGGSVSPSGESQNSATNAGPRSGKSSGDEGDEFLQGEAAMEAASDYGDDFDEDEED